MKKEFVPDISSIDYTARVTIDNPIDKESCVRLKKTTNARICIGRAADRFKTETLLRFSADHAVAIDSVWSHVDENIIDELGFLKVKTLIKDKEEIYYKTRFRKIFF